MFDRFTDRARRAMTNARLAAQRTDWPLISPEHILIGILANVTGVASAILGAAGLDLASVAADLEWTASSAAPPGDPGAGQMPFTADAKRALEFTVEEATGLGHRFLGTEHLLLGILRVPDCCAARVLVDHGVDPDRVRREVAALHTRPPT